MFGSAWSCGSKSIGGSSMKSISPDWSAASAVCSSAMLSQITRSNFTTLPPASPEAGSLRGT